jgi:hypothetical protein
MDQQRDVDDAPVRLDLAGAAGTAHDVAAADQCRRAARRSDSACARRSRARCACDRIRSRLGHWPASDIGRGRCWRRSCSWRRQMRRFPLRSSRRLAGCRNRRGRSACRSRCERRSGRFLPGRRCGRARHRAAHADKIRRCIDRRRRRCADPSDIWARGSITGAVPLGRAPVRSDHGFEFLALHADAMSGCDEFDAIDVELLQEGADAHDIAFLALLAQDLADVLAAKRSVIADRAPRAHLATEFECRRIIRSRPRRCRG